MKSTNDTTSMKNDHTQQKSKAYIFISFFGQGSVAALTGKTCTAPLDRLKILIQTQQPNFQEVGAFKKNGNGIFSAIARIFKSEGFFGLYRGNHIALLRHGLHGGFGFMIHDALHQHFKSDTNKTAISKNFIIGACCGVGATLITFPFETMRVMIATNQGNLRQLIKSHNGSLNLMKRGYSGLSAGLIGVIPYAGLNFGLRDIFKDLLYNNKLLGNTRIKCFDERGMPGWKTSFTLGVCSGLLTQAIVYPVEVVKRRRQNAVGRSYSCIVKELRISGLRSTYAGFSLNIIRHPICNGIVWGMRDFIKRNQLF